MTIAILISAALLGPASSPEAEVRSLVDGFRQANGLPAVHVNSALQAAARAHIAYLLANHTFGHAEDPGRPKFIGRTPDDRARAFGYVGGNSEAVSYSSEGLDSAVEGLFDAPYHRAMFLQPGAPDFGAAFGGDTACIKFGDNGVDGLVESPKDGSRGVPTEWDAIETPDPLRGQPVSGEVGYPIVLAAFGDNTRRFSFVGSTLKKDGRTVETIVLHPGNDRHSLTTVILVPRRPLAASARYDVSVTVSSDGKTVKRNWSFTTGQGLR